MAIIFKKYFHDHNRISYSQLSLQDMLKTELLHTATCCVQKSKRNNRFKDYTDTMGNNSVETLIDSFRF